MKFSLVFLVLLFFGCRMIPTLPFPSLEEIKAYNGSFIAVEGYFAFNFEDVALYPKEVNHTTEFALWLDPVGAGADSLYEKLKGKRVQVVGRVNIASRGHLNGYMATLDSVFYVTEVAP